MTLIYNIRHFKCTRFYWTDYLSPSSCWSYNVILSRFLYSILTYYNYYKDIWRLFYFIPPLHFVFDFRCFFHSYFTGSIVNHLNKKSKLWRSCCLGRGQIHMITSCVLFEADWPHFSVSPSTASTQKVL